MHNRAALLLNSVTNFIVGRRRHLCLVLNIQSNLWCFNQIPHEIGSLRRTAARRLFFGQFIRTKVE